MGDRFDVMPVRVEDERPIIIGVIVRPETGRTVVLGPRRERRIVKRPHLSPVFRREGNVQAAREGLARPDPELRALRAEAGIAGRSVIV
jgi:hypothetical protein